MKVEVFPRKNNTETASEEQRVPADYRQQWVANCLSIIFNIFF